MQQGPLTEEELEFLDDILLKYGSDESVVDASELDGLFTAILSGPVLIEPQVWLPLIWGVKRMTLNGNRMKSSSNLWTSLPSI